MVIPNLALTLFLFAAAPHPPAEVTRLIGVLQNPAASLHDKARACQQLGEFGTREAVPALAALLSHETLGAYARSGLEGIPDPAAAAALRAALLTLKGDRLIGVINSLGVLRDAQATAALAKIAANPRSGAVNEALLALGRISTPETIRILQLALPTSPGAAPAILLAAELQLAANHAPVALQLYNDVRAANVPQSFRLAAMRGAILAAGPDALKLLNELLNSGEREIRNVALLTVREIPSEQLAAVLNSRLESAPPDLQVQLIEAVADCHNPRSLQLVRLRLTHPNPLIRQTALKTLGKLGDRTDAPALLKAVVSGSPEESQAASASLARLQSPDIDALILQALPATSDPGARIALIDLIDARSPLAAAPALLQQAAEPNPAVSLPAFRAIRSVIGLPELPALIALTKTCQDGPRRAAAEAALYYAATRNADFAPAGEMLLSELKQSSADLDKSSWIKTLASMGYSNALPAIAPALRATNPWLAGVAIDSLKNWPGPAPIPDLLQLAENPPDAAARSRALSAALQLATTAGNARQAPTDTVAAWFQRAARSAQSPDDQQDLFSSLGRWTHSASITLLVPYLDKPAQSRAAAAAILAAAGPVAESPDYSILKPILDRLAATAAQPQLDRIANLRRAIAATEAALHSERQKL